MIQLLLVLTSAWGGPYTPKAHRPPVSGAFGASGPDAYGYRYINSDTTAPNAPKYNWIEIRNEGTPINGLGDDNVVGQFPIGFTFPYYWYTVNSIYVGSNGYITFGDNFNASSPFDSIPFPRRPNNTLAPLMSDLVFGTFSGNPAKAWYWTNPGADTFIVEYDSVPFWEPNKPSGVNTFEVILSRPDSTIAFMYKRQTGSPYPAWQAGYATIGIENSTGLVGLRYYYGNEPIKNTLHDTLAVRYDPPESSSYKGHDVAAWAAMNDQNGGIFLMKSQPETLWVKVKNMGNQVESNIPMYGVVKDSANHVVYSDTVTAGVLAPSQVDSLSFPVPWTPSANGRYTAYFITNLAGDQYHGNDTIALETHVVSYPAELGYENGKAINSTSWIGNFGGYGNQFVAPSYPVVVNGLKADLANLLTPPAGCTLWLTMADGPGGSPGTVLARGLIQVAKDSTPTWYTYTLPTPETIAAGAFFVTITSNADSAPNYAYESTPPISHRAWEYTGTWAPSRNADKYNIMMHALVSSNVIGIRELSPVGASWSLSAEPNPFGHATTIRFGSALAKPTALNIYNAAGELVRSITASGKSATWDGRASGGGRVAFGIYFAKLENETKSVLKVVLTR